MLFANVAALHGWWAYSGPVMDATLGIVFGTTEEAHKCATTVRAVHARVQGTLSEDTGRFPAGTSYRAETPELLSWVQATLIDTGLKTYELFFTPLSDGDRETYYYTARDAFRTESSRRTDMAANYVYRVPGGHSIDAFVQAQVLNVFNTQDMCGCGADVFNNGGGVALSRIGSGLLTLPSTTLLLVELLLVFPPCKLTCGLMTL